MSRADCVMLDKGPHVLEAVRALGDILRRMQSHQSKKRPMLRPLKLADRFAARGVPALTRPKLKSGSERGATNECRLGRTACVESLERDAGHESGARA